MARAATRKDSKVPVSERALLQRINRKLAPQDEQMRLCNPDSRWFYDLGRYYVVDTRGNYIAHKDCDIEQTARELGVMRPFERLGQ